MGLKFDASMDEILREAQAKKAAKRIQQLKKVLPIASDVDWEALDTALREIYK